MKFDGEFDQNMEQLIQLLKKILTKHLPQHEGLDWAGHHKDHGINFNICFFTFLADSMELLDELEDFGSHELSPEEGVGEQDLAGRLNSSDLEFLRKNGIRF